MLKKYSARCWFLAALLVVTVAISGAAGTAGDTVVASCAITPEVYLAHDLPKEFAKNNSLLKKSNGIYRARGKVIVIEGRIFDANCVPLTGATVKIWQLNSRGFDQRDLEVDSKNSPAGYTAKMIKLYDANFVSTGTASTDNLGYYRFVTVIPGSDGDRAPRINFVVSHPDFMDVTTMMFFREIYSIDKESGNRITYEDDVILQKFPKQLINLMAANFVSENKGVRKYNFNITLGGVYNYKKY